MVGGMVGNMVGGVVEEEKEEEAVVLHLPTKPLLRRWRRPMVQI